MWGTLLPMVGAAGAARMPAQETRTSAPWHQATMQRLQRQKRFELH